MGIHRELGPGLKENMYQRALAAAFTDGSLAYEAQKFYPVYTHLEQQQLIGYYIPDLVVEGTVIVEIKALKAIDNNHLAQIIACLAVSCCQIGLLINFGNVVYDIGGCSHHRK
jgi:GxxExxY protein